MAPAPPSCLPSPGGKRGRKPKPGLDTQSKEPVRFPHARPPRRRPRARAVGPALRRPFIAAVGPSTALATTSQKPADDDDDDEACPRRGRGSLPDKELGPGLDPDRAATAATPGTRGSSALAVPERLARRRRSSPPAVPRDLEGRTQPCRSGANAPSRPPAGGRSRSRSTAKADPSGSGDDLATVNGKLDQAQEGGQQAGRDLRQPPLGRRLRPALWTPEDSPREPLPPRWS